MDMAMKPACFLAFEVESPVRRESVEVQPRPLVVPQPEPRRDSSSVPPILISAQLEEHLPRDVPPPAAAAQPVSLPEDVSARVPSVNALARLARLERYQDRRRHEVQRQLLDLQITTARTARLARSATSVLRGLAECIRLEDKANFVNLFGSFQRALNECADPPFPHLQGNEFRTDQSEPAESYLDTLPEGHYAAVLAFLAEIRHSGDFIADRIATLSQKEVLALLPEHGASKFSESVLGSSLGNYSRSSCHLGLVVDTESDLLETQAFGSPLETLVSATRGYGISTDFEDRRSLAVWSTVCSRLIMEQKTGSEKLVPAVLDIWAASASWPGKARLELWILQTLRKGSFLTEQPAKQTFRVRIQARPEPPFEDRAKVDRFYESAVHGLMELLADTAGASVIPEPVLQMCQAIWERLSPSPSHQRGFPLFVVRRWLFSSFFSDALALPERTITFLNMLAKEFSVRWQVEHSRQFLMPSIPGEYSPRYGISAANTLSRRHGNAVSTDMTARVEALIKRLTPQPKLPNRSGTKQPTSTAAAHPPSCVVLQPDDIVKMVRSLYPSRRPASLSSDQETLHSGLQSSASSISGYSLFKNLDPPEGDLLFWQDLSSVPSRGLQNHPKPSTDPALDVSSGESAVDEGEVLRRTCRILEEMQSDSAKWAVLLTCRDNQGLQTPRQAGMASPEARGRRTLFGASPKVDWLASLVQQMLVDENVSHLELDHAALQNKAVNVSEYYSVLQESLQRRILTARDNFDFVSAHTALRDLRALDDLCENGANLDSLLSAIELVESRSQQSLLSSEVCMDVCEGWRRVGVTAFETSNSTLQSRASVIRQACDKMWYVADVRTSAAYDEARSVSSALRVMGKPKRSVKTRVAPPLRHWSTSKLTNNNLHLKTEAQILDLLSAAPEHGGPNKLSDDQARTTSQWMDQHSIENLCRGEERLHRLCMEIRKCADRLTGGDALLIATSPLFAFDKAEPMQQSTGTPSDTLPARRDTLNHSNKLSLRTNTVPSIDGMSSLYGHLSNIGPPDYLESRSPTLTHRSSVPFWSPALTEDQSPSSATSIGSYHTRNASQSTPRKHSMVTKPKENESRVEQLRHYLIGMLLSDLAALMFTKGSETDVAFWAGLGGTLTEKHFRSLLPRMPDAESHRQKSFPGTLPRFDFIEAFRNILRSFAATSCPHTKLNLLYDIDRLLPLYLEEDGIERRDYDTIRSADSRHSMRPRHSASPKTDDKVIGFCRLFQDGELRPQAIFRDMQYIAALVSSSTLENTPQGKAFWNAAVAISDLRQQARTLMVETADSIIAYHSNNRGHGRSSSVAQQQRDSATFSPPSRSSSAEEIARYTMADAAYLLQITAKEGDPVAQRELATLYLTHPDLTEHIIAPFARPRDVFKEELENKWRRNMDAEKCDPATMCVAHHWMSLSAKGGDALAAAYLRQREEMDRLL
ncbi:hypothetical protein Tdes44962_MAKER02125 [Teratosphaeria destructans]|uniref:Uncharacterized protein n=1 Tax=Teratosphaeria destructans TaxID=418781 RepID=A0A9W7SUQ7_9PEZI|nr:hypothetical protein Tdes44962_MAKER02125 [Teratosphaeria destructans]